MLPSDNTYIFGHLVATQYGILLDDLGDDPRHRVQSQDLLDHCPQEGELLDVVVGGQLTPGQQLDDLLVQLFLDVGVTGQHLYHPLHRV